MKTVVIFIIIVSLFGACDSENMSKSNLPDDFDNISIKLNENGGMLYFYETINISKDSCVYEINRQGVSKRLVFQLSDNQFDSLYSIFKKNEFDRIRTYEDFETDRGGTIINLVVDNESFEVSNAGLSFVEEEDYGRYINIQNSIREFAYAELDKQKYDVTIELDPTIFDNEYYVKIIIDNIVVLSENKDENYEQFSIRLFNQSNAIDVYFQYYQDDKADLGYLSEQKRFEYVLPNLPENKKIILAIEDGELVVK